MRSPVKVVVGALPAPSARLARAAALLTLLAPGVARAQQITGTVRDARDSSAVAGAIVILLSSSGGKLGGTLAGDDGRYALRVPAAGRYALRVDLVGFRSVNVPPFEIAGQGDVTRDVLFTFERATLPAVTVTTSSRCDRVVGESGDAARLWAEARKALEATRLAQSERRFPVTLQRFEKVVSLPDSVVRSTKRSTEAGVTENPFVSLPPDSIGRVGYRVREDGEELFYAPDAEVLLSDAFVDGHCFQTSRGAGVLASAVGLSFTPSRTRGRTEVAGTLWLDSATAELRSLEFRYEPAPPGGMAGGNVEFGRFPSGGYGVRRWRIWMPAERVAMRRRRPDGSYAFTADTLVTSMREQGGEVVTALGGARGGTRSGAALAQLTVTVFDSTRHVPFAGATVTVEGTGSSALTGDDGSVTLDSLTEEGTFQVRFWHPRLDSLGLGMVRAPVRISRAAASTVTLATPSPATLARTLCTGTSPAPVADSLRVVRGIARSGLDGTPYANAMIDVLWWDGEGQLRRLATQAGDDGRFAACLATPGAFYVSAFHETDVASPVQVGSKDRGVALVSLRLTTRTGLASADSGAVLSLGAEPLAATPRGTSVVTGVVLGTYQEGVANLRASLDGRDAPLRADTSGAFTLPNVTPGPHALTLRALGYAPARVRFRADSSTRIGLYVRLPRSSTTIAEVRVSGERMRAGLDWTRGFDKRRKRAAGGSFLDRAAIERNGGQSLVDLLTGQPGVIVTPENTGYRFYSRLSGGRIGVSLPKTGNQSAQTGDQAAAPELPPGFSEECEFKFLVDGQDYGTSRDAFVGGVVLQIRASDIEAMEIYPGGASIPLEFGGSNARCGVIVIWTRSRVGSSPS
jgi:hypothetical protein